MASFGIQQPGDEVASLQSTELPENRTEQPYTSPPSSKVTQCVSSFIPSRAGPVLDETRGNQLLAFPSELERSMCVFGDG